MNVFLIYNNCMEIHAPKFYHTVVQHLIITFLDYTD